MNSHETEAKFYVRDLKRIEERLHELRAQLFQPRVHEINLRFDNPGSDLRKNLKVLRLRKDTEAKLTFKGPSVEREGGVLSRREIEFTVSDFSAASQFLEALGYEPVVFYEKFRATYELEGVHIMLDELPYGTFVEVEGEDIRLIRKVSQVLHLNWNAMVKAGYHALFERVVGKFNLEPSQLSFKALENIHITPEDLNIIPAD